MKSTKKLLSLLLVLAMVFSLAVPVFAEGETPTTATLASWSGGTSLTNNGENDILKDVTLSVGSVASTSSLSKHKVETSDYGNLSATPWFGTDHYADGTQYAYVAFQLSTKGYENLSLGTVFGGNARVPLTYKLMYSLDNETWTSVDGAIAATAKNTLADAATSTVAVPAAAADKETVYFRITQAEGAQPNDKGKGTNAGALYIYSMALTGTAVAVTPPAGEFEGKTVILHSNDVHGAIAGYANMAALAADYEAKGAKVIIADAGDFSQGNLDVNCNMGLNAVKMMNAAGYNVATLGNHEFDYGYAQLTENLKSADFDVVCCNILDADGNNIFTPSTTVEVGGVKIGFIGVNTPESQTKAHPAKIQGLKWLSGEDMVKAVQAEADKLAETVDVTVVLAHLGVDDSSEPNTSYDLFKGLKGVDFIIDGHSHSVMEKGPNGEPIQSTGTAFKNIGVVVIDNAEKAIESNKLVKITAESAKDETVAAAAQAITEAVNEVYDVKIGESKVNLNGAKSVDANGVYGNRDGETNLGDLITDAMVWYAKKNLTGLTVDADKIVAVANGGGIRASIKAGDITKKDVNNVLPFANTLSVVYMTGGQLLDALEAATQSAPSSLGAFPQVAGIEMTVDTSKAYDKNDNTYPNSTYYGPKSINRVSIDSINGQAFDEKETYAVVTSDFLVAGGDTYYTFTEGKALISTDIFLLDEVLMAYITEQLEGVVGEQYAAPQGRIDFAKAHEHETELKNEKDPTCTEDGYTGDEVCKLCGETVKKGEAIEALGHDFKDGHGTCNVCDFTPFSDIADSGYCDFIVDGYLAGIINGYPDGTFRPNATVTRGQFITMMWRAIGEPEAENADLSFTDAANIPDDYKAAVAWCTENGIIKGYDDGSFRHAEPISRAQMATFSYRLLVLAFGEEAPDDYKKPFGFKDAASVAAPYVDAVNVCANLGIIKGYPDGTFRPNDTGVRGQAATIVLRLVIVIADLAGVLE